MEKRRRARKKTCVSVRFGAEQPDKLGLVTDVSSRGIFISTNTVLPRGTAVRVRMPVRGDEPLLLDGTVVRTLRVAPSLVLIMKGGMGVRLEDAPPAWRTSQSLPEES